MLSLAIVLGTFLWLKLAPRTIYHMGSENSLEGLSQFGAVPDFSLTERSGKNLKLGELRGKIWIADFIYTNCTDTCPMQTATMAKLQDQWANEANLQFVSFSVDPAHDTPAVLSEYAGRYKADAKRWLFLTGGKEEIGRLVQEGFRLSAVPSPDSGEQSGVILHSPRFVLVDKRTQIRGYYDSRDPEALQRLKKDVATLLKSKKE